MVNLLEFYSDGRRTCGQRKCVRTSVHSSCPMNEDRAEEGRNYSTADERDDHTVIFGTKKDKKHRSLTSIRLTFKQLAACPRSFIILTTSLKTRNYLPVPHQQGNKI